ncbi:MAG: N-acetyltransferase [Phycisphaeraceae bacterium]|nr:N-acetyltransferase [Phycisphaeraceae bacterium]
MTAPAPVRLRSATLDDAKACLAIYAPYVRDTVISFEYEPPTVEEMRARISAVLPHKPWLIAETDSGIAGYAYANTFRARVAYQWTAEVALYVDSSHHARGIGRRLYTALIDRLRTQGYRTIVAGISLPNPQSVGFHEALGFRKTAHFPAVGYKFGAWHDTGFWVMDLGPGSAPAPPRSAADFEPRS